LQGKARRSESCVAVIVHWQAIRAEDLHRKARPWRQKNCTLAAGINALFYTRMKNIYRCLLGIFAFVLPMNAQINRPVGINISYVADYSTELVFTNAFRQCRDWISYNSDNTGAWDTGIDIPLRADGYPLEIPYDNGIDPPQNVKTLLTWALYEGTPTGVFRLKTSGTGQIRLSHGVYGTFNSPVDTLITVNNNTGQGGVIFEILSSQASDPIRDVQFILPNYVNSYSTQPFTETFIDFIDDFQVIRFMDFTNTNGSNIVEWIDRTPYDYYTMGKEGGAAWEAVVEIANATQKDIWINIPHKASDAFIDSLAHFLLNNLNANSRIYLEYSNEVWNSVFSQHAYCAQMAADLGYTGQTWERAWKYTAKRSADVFRTFDAVFNTSDRLVKIIPSQAANSWLTNQLVTFFYDPLYNPDQVTADAIAIGPYFGHSVANTIANAGLTESISVEAIIDSLAASIPEAQQWIQNNVNVATNRNLDLINYEGGQHLVATGNNLNIDALTEKLKAANHHEGMYDLYCNYMNYWYEQAGGLFCHFTSTQRYTKYGSWGLKEFEHDTLNPKYRGMQDCVFAYNDAITHTANTDIMPNIYLAPNPTNGLIEVMGSENSTQTYEVLNIQGRIVQMGLGIRIDLSQQPTGIYFIRIDSRVYKIAKH
jgi:hypothetical protein